MGLDLSLLPLQTDPDMDWGFSHTILDLWRCRDLFDKIGELDVIERPDFKFLCYLSRHPEAEEGKYCGLEGEHCYGELTETPYGDPLTWTKAGALASVMEDYYQNTEDDNRPRINLAAIAYLRLLDPDTPVALYWH